MSGGANRGSTTVGHTELCRKRIVGELEKAGDERIERERDRDRDRDRDRERETERISEYLE